MTVNRSVAATAPGLNVRLACLLPGLDDAARQPIAVQLEAHVRQLVMQGWSGLVQSCASGQRPANADTLRAAASDMPDPEPLLARLGSAITPALLLCLPLPDRAAVTAALLSHPDAQTREQALDALADGSTAGCRPLRRACLAWSRRMLVAELGRMPGLSHIDRLELQERLLDAGGDALPDEAEEPLPEAGILSDALRHAANREATALLAQRAGVAEDTAEMAVALRDPKMLVALCWKAGCDPAEALAVQVQLGHVPPDQVLRVGPDDQWPLDPAAMQWQVGLLDEI